MRDELAEVGSVHRRFSTMFRWVSLNPHIPVQQVLVRVPQLLYVPVQREPSV